MTEDDISEGVRQAAALCRQFEGLWLAPYFCPAGKASIGYGSTVYEDGQSVSIKDPSITAVYAELLLQSDMTRTRLPGVLRLCPQIDTPGRLAALLDFAYNAGIAALGTSMLRKRVNDGDWSEAATEIKKWVHGGGQVLPGLVRRRDAEAALLMPNAADKRRAAPA